MTLTIYLIIAGVAVVAFLLGWGITALLLRQKRELAVADCEAALNATLGEVAQSLATAQEKNQRIPELELNLASTAQEMRAYRDQQGRVDGADRGA